MLFTFAYFAELLRVRYKKTFRNTDEIKIQHYKNIFFMSLGKKKHKAKAEANKEPKNRGRCMKYLYKVKGDLHPQRLVTRIHFGGYNREGGL